MADMKQVLRKLVERTKQNRVPWSKGNLSDTYNVSVGSLTVLIMGGRRGISGTIYLSVNDHTGESVDRVFYNPEEPELNPELVALLEGARRIADDDPRLDELLDALDAVPPVSQ